MIISHKYKFIFVKTRKTAGSTFEKLIRPYLGKDDICTGSTRDGTDPLNCKPDTNGHLPLKDILRDSFVDGHSGYDYFTIERNPYDKVVSSYYWHQHIKPDQFGDMSFQTYMKTCNLLPRDWKLYTINGEMLENMKVYKYENIYFLYTMLKNKYGIDISMETVHNTRLKSGLRKVNDYREIHSNTTRKIVSDLFADEIKEFNYEF